MSVRTSVVLPAPRSPESVTKSPPWSELAMSMASRRVACSSGNATEKLDVAEAVSAMACLDARSRGHGQQASRRRSLGGVIEREDAGDRGAAADGGFERHRAAMQLDERAHQGQAEARAAVARAERMGLEPIEHLVLYIGRDAGPAIGHREYDGVPAPLGGKSNDLAAGRKAHGIGQQIEQRLPHAPLVGDEGSDLRAGAAFGPEALLDQAVLHPF